MQQGLERTNDAEKEEGRTGKAQQIGQPMKIAVVDSGRNMLSYVRMDDAWIGSIASSINKAFTRGLSTPRSHSSSKTASPASSSWHSLWHSRIQSRGRDVFAGGIPLRRNGAVIGAIGVSGRDGN